MEQSEDFMRRGEDTLGERRMNCMGARRRRYVEGRSDFMRKEGKGLQEEKLIASRYHFFNYLILTSTSILLTTNYSRMLQERR